MIPVSNISEACLFPLTIALVSITVCLSGCSKNDLSLGEVSGIVTLDGTPVKDAIVKFSPAVPGRWSGSDSDENGAYRLVYDPQHTGALIGTHVVTLSVNEERALELTGKRESVTLTKEIEVKSGQNTINLELREFTVQR